MLLYSDLDLDCALGQQRVSANKEQRADSDPSEQKQMGWAVTCPLSFAEQTEQQRPCLLTESTIAYGMN